MDINRDNYEAFFLDFAEGRLSAEQEEMLHHFLRFNPDLANELKEIDLLRIEPSDVRLPIKETLKKNIPGMEEKVSDYNFEMFAIAFLEQDLSNEQKIMFEDYLEQHPERKNEFELYRKTYLVPTHISFPARSRLKHRHIRIFSWQSLAPIAAAAAIAFLVIFRMDHPLQTNNIDVPEEMAMTTSPEKSDTPAEIPGQIATPKKNNAAATVKVIRDSNVPVPVSNYTPPKNQTKLEEPRTEENPQKPRPRIARMDLTSPVIRELPMVSENIEPVPVALPMINASSLSFVQRARYTYNVATEIADNEDPLIISIVSSGLKEINRLTGTDMKLLASKNQNGDVSGIQFRSRFLTITTPIQKNDN